ncbi:hypothetical protein AVEN_83645-1 [Araneus ventricosus]|uniref:Uncharacterized protein n=1 Tax=Araneus ventricosus TaxID=182803 RepID=A0A4Y2PM68_ARAVE|nr:hypothetical protein AVEN_83645-1 [Araneus ventricosus]
MATLNRTDTRMKLIGSDDDVLLVMQEHKDALDKEKIYYYYMPPSIWKSDERAEPMMKELYEIARKRLVFPNFKILLKRLNEVQKLVYSAKSVGEFMHVFTKSSKDHRQLTDHLDRENIEHYVLHLDTERPIKIVIKGLPIDPPIEQIKVALTAKKNGRNQPDEKKIKNQATSSNFPNSPPII